MAVSVAAQERDRLLHLSLIVGGSLVDRDGRRPPVKIVADAGRSGPAGSIGWARLPPRP